MNLKPLFTLPLALAAINHWSLFAQESDDPVFELSAFEVNTSADRGYIASNAISAYRINLPIQDIPIQIKVVTREFLDDIKAVDLEEALGYSVGVARDNPGSEGVENGRFSIRGLQAAFPKRNGYRRYYTVDMTNVERVEVIKGPASALFGEAQPGGIINYVTKKPLTEPKYGLTATYGSYDYRRALVEATGPLNDGKTLLYRVDASYMDRNDYRDFAYEQRTVIAPVIEWRPSKNTSLKFDYEYIKRDFNPPTYAPIYNKRAAEFFEALPTTPVNLREIAINSELRADPASLEPFINTWRIFIPDGAIPEDINDLYYFRDIQEGIPREWSSMGPNTWNRFESDSFTLEGNHTFRNGSSLRFAASTATIDTAGLRARPNRTRVWGDGFYRGQRLTTAENQVGNIQMDYLVPVDLDWSRHTLIIGAEIFQDDFKSLQFTDPEPGQAFFMQSYFLDTPVPSRRIDSQGNFVNFGIREYPVDVEGVDSELYEDPTRQERRTHSFYVSDQMVFLKDRLRVLAGVRFDSITQDIYYWYTREGRVSDEASVERWSPQLGVNFDVSEGMAVYTNYSQSFSPGLGSFDSLNPDGTTTAGTRPPEIGDGRELGIKFMLLDGRLSGTVAWFDIEKEDVTLTLRSEGGTAYNILVDDSSKGFELDFAYEIFTGFQFLFGYAYTDSFRNDPSAPEWVQDIESRVPGVPENQITFWSKYTFTEGILDGLSIGGGVQWMEEFRASAALPDVLVVDGHTKVDLLLSYKIAGENSDWKLDLFVDNLFDDEFYFAGPLPANPRNYKITVGYSF